MSSSTGSVVVSEAFKQRLQVECKARCQKQPAIYALMAGHALKVIGKESTQNVMAAVLQAASHDANVEAFFMKTWADCDSFRPESSKRKLESGDVKPDWQDGEIDPV
jgi:hypothetical protein